MITETMAKLVNEIALDRENKIKQAIKDGYDFIAIENNISRDKIEIRYVMFKGEVPNANKYREIYNLTLLKDLLPKVRLEL